MKKWTTLLLTLIIAIGAFIVGYTLLQEPETPEYTPPVLSKYEVGPMDIQEMLELVNKERIDRGIALLTLHESLSKSAQLKADDMWNRNYRSHFLPEDPKATLTLEMASYVEPHCESSSENLVFNDGTGPMTSSNAIYSLMNSKPHREAILNPDYSMIGMGVSNNDIAVQHFCIAK